MNNLAKSFFISLYVTALALVSAHAAYGLYTIGFDSVWTGVAIAIWPALAFFVRLFAAPIARTSSNLNSLLVPALIGLGLSVILMSGPEQQSIFYRYNCALGLGGLLLYVYWYSRLGRAANQTLDTGNTLPNIVLHESNGKPWEVESIRGSRALILFFRGNWCPLCMAQIKEIAGLYQKLESMGVKVYLVSPQPDKHTASLAAKFDVNFNFMVDKNGQAAKILGIDSKQGTPKGMEALGYESDTVLPTAILLNAKGAIIYTDQTDNYRVRPEPQTFIDIFETHAQNA